MDFRAEKAVHAIEEYLKIRDVPVEDVYIDLQPGWDERKEKHNISYVVAPLEGIKQGNVFQPAFYYDSAEEIVEAYPDHWEQVYENFEDAELAGMDPDLLEAPYGGGNPLMYP